MPTLTVRSPMPVSPEGLLAWHARAGAFERLAPPWVRMRVRRDEGPFERRVLEFEVARGPARVRWVARHEPLGEGAGFVDVQEHGPMRSWRHEHRFEAGAMGAVLRDVVRFSPPLGRAGWLAAGGWMRRDLERLFAYRHARVRADLARLEEFDLARGSRRALRVGVTGASGAIGSNLSALLRVGGHEVRAFVRRRPSEGEAFWQPGAGKQGGQLERADLDGLDAVVHLAGANAAGARWTRARREEIRASRVEGTALIARTMAGMARPPGMLIVASGVGFYGDRGEEELTEASGVGSGFLAELVRDWEAAAEPARQAGVRVVHLRYGIVLDAWSGAVGAMRGPFGLGLGCVVGSGRQWWPWVTMDDAVAATLHAIASAEATGPVNVSAPARAGEFAWTLARVCGRDVLARIPAWVASLAMPGRSSLVLASARAVPGKLRRAGFRFAHERLEPALRWTLGALSSAEAGVEVAWER